METLTVIQAVTMATLIITEALVSYTYDLHLYEKRDTFVSLVIGAISTIVIFSTKAFFLGVLIWFHQFSLFNINNQWFYWIFLFLLCDLAYYSMHILSHKVRFLWASHMVHHSSEKLNFTTNLRSPVVYLSFRMIFWTPMVLIGFRPEMIVITDSILQLYTAFTHTNAIGKLGPFEKIFNTPSHHRLHHASNEKYIDKNFGGLLIIWDKIFGTFATTHEKPVFGIAEVKDMKDPIKIILYEWKQMIKDIKKARSFHEALKLVFGSP